MSAAEFKAKGNAALQAKNFDEAIAMYTEAIKLDDSNHVFFSNRSAAYLSKGDAESALADGTRCVELNPSWPKGYSRKGAALHHLRRYDDAEAVFNEGLTAVPDDPKLAEGLASVRKDKAAAANAGAAGGGAAGGMPNPFGNLLGRLATHPKFGEWVQNQEIMQKINMMQQNPQLISAFLQDPQMSEVIQALLGGLGAGPAGASEPAPAAAPTPTPMETEPPAPPRELTPEEQAAEAIKEVRARGNAHYKAKEFEQALACYDEVIARDPEQISVLNNKAAVFVEMKDYEAAENQLKDAVEQARSMRPTPFDVIAKFYVRWGNMHAKRKNLALAMEYYEKAQMENSTKEVERLIKTTKLEKQKADKLAYINPELALEAKERGNDAFRSEQWGKAIQEYEEAIKRDPSNPAYRNNLAATLCKVMDFQGAKAACEKALELDPRYVKAWARKGDIELLQKEYHKAMESYQKGLDIDPEFKLCKDGLQKVMLQINQSSASGEVDQERAAHAMADPEIQAILGDPVVRQVIQDLGGNDPAAGQRALQDPGMAAKIQKLIAAGVLQTR